MTVSYTSLGCKVNQYEVRTIVSELIEAGFSLVDFENGADVCIINTCCVTGTSEAKSRKAINRARRINPDGIIAVTGCFSQIYHQNVSSADLVVSNTDKKNFAQILMEYLVDIGMLLPKPGTPCGNSFLHSDRTRATIKVQDGCDSFCAYCIIPYARGALCSTPLSKVCSEVRALAAEGYKEIVLTGIHLTKYGSDLEKNIELIDLLKAVNEIDGIERIRLGSLEPMYFDEDRVGQLTSVFKLCPHFHLSLQSGCDETLKRMNRHYTSEQYFSEVSLLRETLPDCAITTDIMVGFPGETEEEFAQTLKFVERCSFAKAHIFTYSPRPGTPAALMVQVDEQTKAAHSKAMFLQTDKDRQNFLKGQVGKIVPVLFENAKGKYAFGYTPNYAPVKVKTGGNLANKILDVKILNNDTFYCEGDPV